MKKMPMRYQNKCRGCGIPLPVGIEAWMGKIVATGRWVFECVDCHAGNIHHPVAGWLDDDIMEILSFNGDEVAMPLPETKKDPLEELKMNAKWRLIDAL